MEDVASLRAILARAGRDSIPSVWWSSHELTRVLRGSGFHLELQTSSQGLRSSASGCSHWALIEQLPPGAFFDPHQLDRLGQFGKLGGADGVAVLNVVSPELLTSDSRPIRALVHGPLGTSSDGLLSVVPLHLRYDAPSTNATHRAVILPPPQLFLCCTSRLWWRRAERRCRWRRARRVLAPTLKARVPVGQLVHAEGVVVFTVLSILVGMCALLFASPGGGEIAPLPAPSQPQSPPPMPPPSPPPSPPPRSSSSPTGIRSSS